MRIVPASPTATKLAPDQATALRVLVDPELRTVHGVPPVVKYVAESGAVTTVPLSPTAANWEPDQATALNTAPVPE